MASLLTYLKLDQLEQAINTLESKLAKAQNPSEEVARLVAKLAEEEKKRENISQIIDQTIETVESLVTQNGDKN